MSDIITAVVADDEPLLSQALTRALNAQWPELQIIATSNNGTQALADIFEHRPDVVFLDIQMPGATGIEVAQTLAEDWPDSDNTKKPPLIVFVTAFDDYAIQAFAAAAFDYLMKPVKPSRLTTTIERLMQRLKEPNEGAISQLSSQISQLLKSDEGKTAESVQKLRVIRASVGESVRMIPVDDVILLESADKYVTVYSLSHQSANPENPSRSAASQANESLIREPLRKLLPQLDDNQFAQIHRSTIVNLDYVEAAIRDETGKVSLTLSGTDKTPVVSRLYRHLFQAM